MPKTFREIADNAKFLRSWNEPGYTPSTLEIVEVLVDLAEALAEREDRD